MESTVLLDTPFLCVTTEEQIDCLDGKILPAGTTVICSPLNLYLVAKDSPERQKLFINSSYAWDEQTRFLRVKNRIDALANQTSYGNIRSIDIANDLTIEITLVEKYFNQLATPPSDYVLIQALDSHNKPCTAIKKRLS